MITVLVLSPDAAPQPMELDDTRIEDDGGRIVGDRLEFVRVTDGPNPWGIYAVHGEAAATKPVAAVVRHRGAPYKLRGTCFFTAVERQGIRSLTDDEISKLRKQFAK